MHQRVSQQYRLAFSFINYEIVMGACVTIGDGEHSFSM